MFGDGKREAFENVDRVTQIAITVVQEGFLDFARNDDGAKRYQNSTALLVFMRRTTTLNPST